MARICFTDVQERRLADGWPHRIELVDGHQLDKRPHQVAAKELGALDPFLFGEWPREVAHRFVRSGCTGGQYQDTAHESTALKIDVQKALSTPGPVSVDEGVALLRNALRISGAHYPFQAADYVFAVEAIIGTEPTLEAMVSMLEEFAVEDWIGPGDTPLHTYFKGNATHEMGFMFLRVDEAKRAAFVRRLERVFQAAKSALDERPDLRFRQVGAALDRVLHGAAAVRAQSMVWPHAVEHVTDDPALVREAAARSMANPLTVRHVWLGGLEVMTGFATRKLPRAAQVSAYARDFGMIKSPEIVSMMVSLVGKKSAGNVPLEWFLGHRDFAAPVLEPMAKRGGPTGERAKMLLRASGARGA